MDTQASRARASGWCRRFRRGALRLRAGGDGRQRAEAILQVAIALAFAAAWAGEGSADVLYECPTPSGAIRYSAQPCSGTPAARMAIDRIVPVPAVAGSPPAAAGAPAARPREGPPHRLTLAERERLAALAGAMPALGPEARLAAEIEAAAIREGADAALDHTERALLDALRHELRDPDPAVRQRSLEAWRGLYRLHRPGPRPRGPALVPRAVAGTPALSVAPAPPSPTGPPAPSGATAPAGPVAQPAPSPRATDPSSGQVLVPMGERQVDPATGTIWMRAGPNYVDPATGRIIPAP